MKKIEVIREKIDKVDSALIRALLKRIELAKEIAAYKKTRDETVYRPEREEQILKKALAKLTGTAAAVTEEVMRTVISSCRNLQKNISVSYLGPRATFTHNAAVKIFGSFCRFLPAVSIGDVFSAVETGRADFGVVPIENSTEGMVNHTMDMFAASPLKIIKEEYLAISHCLVSAGKNKNKIKKLYSHPSVFGQCRNYISRNLPLSEKTEVSSTAEAVKMAAKWPALGAAISSKFAAQMYGMNILDEHIEDMSQNYTRFLVMGKSTPETSGKDKTSFLFSLKDKPGILHDALTPFKKRNINLKKIESRPSKKKAWEYLFFVDCEGHIGQKKIQNVVSELSKFCDSLKILGSYPEGRLPKS
ncbi:MAG: prephenate dehydratase [Elusimicrobiota bacterium]|nr:prephenate dehydratase [Elusimicrobiota bacterium]